MQIEEHFYKRQARFCAQKQQLINTQMHVRALPRREEKNGPPQISDFYSQSPLFERRGDAASTPRAEGAVTARGTPGRRRQRAAAGLGPAARR